MFQNSHYFVAPGILVCVFITSCLSKMSYSTEFCDIMESKKISNDQELIQSVPHPALKTKREITKYIN